MKGTTETRDEVFSGNITQELIDSYSAGYFSTHTINHDLLVEKLEETKEGKILFDLLDKLGFTYSFDMKGSGWVGVDHESVGEGSRQTLRGEKYLIDVLFGSSYFELGTC